MHCDLSRRCQWNPTYGTEARDDYWHGNCSPDDCHNEASYAVLYDPVIRVDAPDNGWIHVCSLCLREHAFRLARYRMLTEDDYKCP